MIPIKPIRSKKRHNFIRNRLYNQLEKNKIRTEGLEKCILNVDLYCGGCNYYNTNIIEVEEHKRKCKGLKLIELNSKNVCLFQIEKDMKHMNIVNSIL